MERIPEEIVRAGMITIYADDSDELLDSVNAYNRHMGDCRIKKAHLREAVKGFVVMNPVVLTAVAAADAERVFSRPVNIAFIAIFAMMYLIFGLYKNNFIIGTVSTLVLAFASPVFLVLTAGDIVISLIYYSILSPLKKEQGYPAFLDILIKYEKCKRPGDM